ANLTLIDQHVPENAVIKWPFTCAHELASHSFRLMETMQALQCMRAQQQHIRAFRAVCFHALSALLGEVVIACVESESSFFDEHPSESLQPRCRSVADERLLLRNFFVAIQRRQSKTAGSAL